MNLILDAIWQSTLYVIADGFFWPSMAATVIIGIFIGAVVYDGCVKEIKKIIVSMVTYALMIIAVTTERVIPLLFDGVFRVHKPFAGTMTVLFVTIFYVLGMIIGILVTKKAHQIKE